MPSTSRLLAIVASATLICWNSAAQAEATKLNIGVAGESDPPFVALGSDGKLSGLTLDLIAAVCKEIPADCSVVDTAWDGLIPSLRSKKIDAIFSGMGITEEREKVIAFSDPYFTYPRWLVGAKSASLNLTIEKPESFSGLVVGAQTSSSNANYLKKYVGKQAEIKLYDRQDSMFADLAAGRIDLAMSNSIAATSFLQSPEGSLYEKKLDAPYDALLGRGDGVGLRKEDEELRLAFNKAIAKIKSNGEFERLFTQYFPGMKYE